MDTLQAKIDHRLFTVLQSLHIKLPELHLKRWSNYMHAQTYGRTIEVFSVFNIHDEILVLDNESSKFCRRFSDNKKEIFIIRPESDTTGWQQYKGQGDGSFQE
jgi:hypothetical protein